MSEQLFMKYFVLKPAGDDVFAKASRRAMRAYAHMLRSEGKEYDEFAKDLLAWAGREFQAYLERTGGHDEENEE